MAENATLQHLESWPWYERVSGYAPFQLDALGIVTLLGHEEVNAALGRLVPSRYLEYFPMLGAFVIAGDRFKDKKPSFNVYNVDQGIQTTNLACWLSRWILAQDFHKTLNIVQFQTAETPRAVWQWRLVALALSFVFTGGLLVMCILSDDKYGKVNAVAMIVSIMVRAWVLESNRWAIDRAVKKGYLGLKGEPEQLRKVVIVTSDSKAVTMFWPGHLIIDVFTSDPDPKPAKIYHAIRWIGWAAFAVHVLTIGNAFWPVQIYVVGLIVVPTVLVHWKLGCDDSQWLRKWNRIWGEDVVEPYDCWFGSRLKATVFEWPLNVEFTTDATVGRTLRPLGHDPNKPQKWYRLPDHADLKQPRSGKRQDLYAWLNLSVEEESSMGKWDLFPHERTNTKSWWADYNEKKALVAADPWRLQDMRRRKMITKIKKRVTSEVLLWDLPLTAGTEYGQPQPSRDEEQNIGMADHDDVPLQRVSRAPTDVVSGPDGMIHTQPQPQPGQGQLLNGNAH